MTEDQRQAFGPSTPEKLAGLGKRSKAAIARGLPALGQYVKATQAAHGRGYLKGLDGRKLASPSAHSAPNTVLQSAGALIMKRALVMLDADIQTTLNPGVDYEFVANVHDEFQIECLPQHANTVGQAAAQAITQAAAFYSFRCPLSGSYDTGPSWGHTH